MSLMNAPLDASSDRKRSLLIDVRMILHLQPSFCSYIGRALTFLSEGCEFEPRRGRELSQKNRVFFLIIEEQLSMLKFFRLCMMETFLMSPLSKRKNGKIFPCLLFQKGRTGKAKDPPPLLKYKLKRMNSQKSRKINK